MQEKVLLFSDIHGSVTALQAIADLLHRSKFSALIFAGDFLNMGQPDDYAEKVASLWRESGVPLFWVSGNNDFGYGYDRLLEILESIEGRAVTLGGRTLIGIAGSPPIVESGDVSGKMVNPEMIAGTVFVSHYPPAGKRLYQKNDDDLSPLLVNSKPVVSMVEPLEIRNLKQAENHNLNKVRTAIYSDIQTAESTTKLAHSPLVHICGHIHYQWGVSYIGSTKVIKLGAAVDGYYATMDLSDLHVDFFRF